VINGSRLPADGADETDGVNDAILLYRNDTFSGRGAWGDAIPKSAPVQYRPSFVAAGLQATLILRTGNNNPGGTTGTAFSNMAVHAVPAPTTLASLPSGFALRALVFPVSSLTCLAQSPVSRKIYAVRNNQEGGDSLLYRVDIDGPSLSAVQVADLSAVAGLSPGLTDAQGMTFDPAGNVYISTFYGRLVKGVDTDPDPAIDSFSFSQMFDLPDSQIGTFHGVGGVAVGPDGFLYINSGSSTHYGPETDTGYNMRILRAPLTATSVTDVQTFCQGIRNSFDITFRSDGKLFGVENGPNINCDYADEFNLLEGGAHYGFPYVYGSDLSGSDNSITCTSDPPRVGPPPLPEGLVTRPAWANYGPNAKPAAGERGYANGGEYYGFNPHSSPDGLDFYEPALMDPTAVKFPPEYQGRAFVARFGNLEDFSTATNPNPPYVGFDILTLRLDEPNQGFLCNTFLSGMARAIDVLCAYNGKLYVLEYNQQTVYPGANWGTPSRLYEISYTVPTLPITGLSTHAINRTVDYTEVPGVNDSFTVANLGAGVLNYGVTVQFDSGDPAWLQVDPAAGTSSGPGDVGTITLSYLPAVAGLSIASHVATVTVSDPQAQNPAETVTVTLKVKTVLGDLDKDGDVDQADFGMLQVCYNAPGVPPTPECQAMDLNHDMWVGGPDYSVLQGCLSGSGVVADKSCDDAYE